MTDNWPSTDAEKTERAVVSLLALVVVFPLGLWSGFVLQHLWAWFVVPAIGAQPIGTLHAMGLSLVVAALRTRTKRRADRRWLVESIEMCILDPATVLGIGWLVKELM